MPEIDRYCPASMHDTETYSHGVAAGNLLFIAGQVGALGDGSLAGEGMGDQLRQALTNVRTVLEERGATFANVVNLQYFVTDMDDFLASNAIKWDFYEGRPTDFVVEVARLAEPQWKVEVAGIAVL